VRGVLSFALRTLALAAACALLVPCIGLAQSTPTPVRKAEPPLANARLVGRFHVTSRLVRVKGMWSKVGEKSETAWALIPQCPRGACSTRAVFTYINRETKKKLTIRIPLKRDGGAYTGSGIAPLAKCNGQRVRGKVTIRLIARHGEIVSSVWRVARWTASMTVDFPATEVGRTYCDAASYTESLGGSLPE
jgi:hypothetical protein